jgi:hypothetical protein
MDGVTSARSQSLTISSTFLPWNDNGGQDDEVVAVVAAAAVVVVALGVGSSIVFQLIDNLHTVVNGGTFGVVVFSAVAILMDGGAGGCMVHKHSVCV